MLKAQAKWLNKMALRGWRLADTGKLDYSFIPCEPGAYQYAVDFVGNLSRAHGDDYAAFLSGFGYKTWFKNVNLQWSRGKVRWNPAGEPGARIISDRTNLDRELLIVERRAEPGEFCSTPRPWTRLRSCAACAGAACAPPSFSPPSARSLSRWSCAPRCKAWPSGWSRRCSPSPAPCTRGKSSA